MRRLQNDLDAFYNIDKDIAQVMGTESALRLVSPEYRVQLLNDHHNFVRHNRISCSAFDPNVSVMDVEQSITHIILNRLLTEIRYHPHTYRYHIRVGFKDGKQAGLYFDPDYITHVGLTPRDIKYIAEDLANQLGNFINGSKGKTDKE